MKKIKYVAAVISFEKNHQDRYFKETIDVENWVDSLTEDEKKFVGYGVISKCYFASNGELTADERTAYNAWKI